MAIQALNVPNTGFLPRRTAFAVQATAPAYGRDAWRTQYAALFGAAAQTYTPPAATTNPWAFAPVAQPTVASVAPVAADPDPVAFAAALTDYRAAIFAADKASAGTENVLFSGLFGQGNHPVFLLPGMMIPYGVRLLTLAWFGREPNQTELATYQAMLSNASGTAQSNFQAVITDIGNRGLAARLQGTTPTADGIAQIQQHVGSIMVWPADVMTSATVTPAAPASTAMAAPPAPPVPAPAPAPLPPAPPAPLAPLNPWGVTTAAVGATPLADAAASPAATALLKSALTDYRNAVNALAQKNDDMMTAVLSGEYAGGAVCLLPGLMLPYGARLMTIAGLGREPNATELARWQAMLGTPVTRDGFAAVLADVNRTILAARLPETDGSSAAIQKIQGDMGKKLVWSLLNT